ncbi:MAG: hypothetical protein WCV90_02635 [Candidatus Woesearchaeota archaeon]|jgi:hypothetical protein
MIKVKSEKELLNFLQSDVDTCRKDKIVLLSGHFPLIYTKEKAIEAIDYWGPFSKYSLELACKIGKYARNKSKTVEFVFFVDDHSYEGEKELSLAQAQTRRNKLYKECSGEKAELAEAYHKIMNKYGFSEKDIIRQNQGKNGREDCLYFSEKILRASSRKIENLCAKEYSEFIENPRFFNKNYSHLISFIPRRCQAHICNVALDKEIKGLSASHIFMETMLPTLTKKELYTKGSGVMYRKD